MPSCLQKNSGGNCPVCPFLAAALAHTQDFHIKKRNGKLVMHEQVSLHEQVMHEQVSYVKQVELQLFWNLHLKLWNLVQRDVHNDPSSIFIVIFPWSHDLEKVASRSVWMGLRFDSSYQRTFFTWWAHWNTMTTERHTLLDWVLLLPNLHLQLNPDLTGCFITPRWNRHKQVGKTALGVLNLIEKHTTPTAHFKKEKATEGTTKQNKLSRVHCTVANDSVSRLQDTYRQWYNVLSRIYWHIYVVIHYSLCLISSKMSQQKHLCPDKFRSFKIPWRSQKLNLKKQNVCI